MGINTTYRTLAIAATLSILATGFSAAAPPSAQRGELLVGFEQGIDLQLLSGAGAQVKRVLADRVVLVDAADADGLAARLLRSPAIDYVTPNQPLRLAGSSPDGTHYEATTWDATTWDATTWDATTWDATTWDATTWDATTWDANGQMDPAYDVQWGIGAANYPDAWNVTYGTGSVTVCVLDTGVDHTHPDLQVNLLRDANGAYGYNAMNGTTWVMDDVGHGTHVAGILAATGANGIGTTGIVRSKVLSVKVMGSNGGTEADLIAGLDHCVARGAKVASMSLHVDAHDPALQAAIESAQAAGVLVVAAAGNDGVSPVAYPAAYPGVIAVGAILPSGDLAGFSNRGSGLDLVAPGYRIASTGLGGSYVMGSGTSQAVPFVSGAAALMWEKNSSLTASQVSGLLTSTARDLGAAGFDTTFGHGALDAGAAVMAA